MIAADRTAYALISASAPAQGRVGTIERPVQPAAVRRADHAAIEGIDHHVNRLGRLEGVRVWVGFSMRAFPVGAMCATLPLGPLIRQP